MSRTHRALPLVSSVGRLVAGALVLALSAQPLGAHQRTSAGTISETRLQAWERAFLGPAHAAQHARTRALARLTPKQRAAARRRTLAGRPRVARAVRRQHDPSVDGQWGAPFALPVMAIHGAVLPTGKVLWFSYPKNPSRGPGPTPNEGKAWLWDPAKGTGADAFKDVRPPIIGGVPANIWCAGQTHLADGQILVAGGNLAFYAGGGPGGDFKGLNKVFTFDPFTETWTPQPDMAHGRWYPTLTRLGDGKVVITSGLDETGDGWLVGRNLDIEVFTPAAARGGVGTITKTGERTAGDSGAPGQPPNGNFYPHQFLLPNGRMALTGPNLNDSWLLDSPSTGTNWTDLPNLDSPGALWSSPGGPQGSRLWATGVLMPAGLGGTGRIMLTGGSDLGPTGYLSNAPQTRTSTIIDATAGTPTWQSAPSMNVARSHHQTVLLPDGSMVSVGGGYGIRNDDQWAAGDEHRPIEIRDAATGAWRLGPAQAEYRAYHSTAMLLPDGRVVSGGDDFNGGYDRDTAEIYSPPYLFKGPRPIVDAVADRVGYGQSLGALTSPGVTRAALVAPAAVTHAVDMNQRLINLPVAARQDGRGVDLTMPGSVNVAPPGFYMLFLMNADGVPALARWVRLDPSAPQPAPPEYPAPLATSVSPVSLAVGGPGQLVVDGARFSTSSRVLVGGSERATTYVSASRLVADLTAADVAEARVLAITVTTPAPGGGTTSPLSVTVSNPVPQITSVAPGRLTRGTKQATVTVTGSGFVASSRLLWAGDERASVVLGPGRLTATLTGTDLSRAGARQVQVRTPGPGGGTSRALSFTIDPLPLRLALRAPTRARPGAIVTVSVRLSRIVKAQGVVLQRGTGTRYVRLARGRVSGRTVTFSVRFPRTGAVRLRAVTRERGLLRRSAAVRLVVSG